jgi:hypothetical protein
MTKYTLEERDQDAGAVANALQYLDNIRKEFADVIAIPFAITLKDVAEMTLDTSRGPQKIGDYCSRKEMVAILEGFALEDNACADPAQVAQYALKDYRETHTPEKE